MLRWGREWMELDGASCVPPSCEVTPPSMGNAYLFFVCATIGDRLLSWMWDTVAGRPGNSQRKMAKEALFIMITGAQAGKAPRSRPHQCPHQRKTSPGGHCAFHEMLSLMQVTSVTSAHNTLARTRHVVAPRSRGLESASLPCARKVGSQKDLVSDSTGYRRMNTWCLAQSRAEWG